MNKTIITGLIFLSVSLGNNPLWAQQDSASENIPELEDDTIGGIGGTGIRSMSRPEILERPEQLERPVHFERPEISESRDALEDLGTAADAAMDRVDMPEKPE